MAGRGMGKMIIGQAGKQYGLLRPGLQKKPLQTSVFGDADEEDIGQDPNKVMMSDKHRQKMEAKAEKERAKALAEDATIFDYDGALDNITAERERVTQARQNAAQEKRKEVRYVHALMEKTKERKKEDERLYEKRLIKELQEETAETGEEKFVTSAYKKQLQANKKWEEEQKRRDAWAERDDVTKKDGLSDFYSSMFRGKNKATGANVRGATTPPEPEPEPEPEVDFNSAPPQEGGVGGDREGERGGEKRRAEEMEAGAEEEEEKVNVSMMPSAREAMGTDAQGEANAKEEEAKEEAAVAEEKGGGGDEGGESEKSAAAGEEGGAARKEMAGWVKKAYGYVPAKAEIVQSTAEKKSQDEVLSAKERYLQRKKAKTGAA